MEIVINKLDDNRANGHRRYRELPVRHNYVMGRRRIDMDTESPDTHVMSCLDWEDPLERPSVMGLNFNLNLDLISPYHINDFVATFPANHELVRRMQEADRYVSSDMDSDGSDALTAYSYNPFGVLLGRGFSSEEADWNLSGTQNMIASLPGCDAALALEWLDLLG